MSDLEARQKIDKIRQIDQLRGDLGEKLDELHRRAAHAKELLSPAHYWHNPWVRLGIGVAIGFTLGSRRRSAGMPEGLLHAMVRAGLYAAIRATIQRALDPTRATRGS